MYCLLIVLCAIAFSSKQFPFLEEKKGIQILSFGEKYRHLDDSFTNHFCRVLVCQAVWVGRQPSRDLQAF